MGSSLKSMACLTRMLLKLPPSSANMMWMMTCDWKSWSCAASREFGCQITAFLFAAQMFLLVVGSTSLKVVLTSVCVPFIRTVFLIGCIHWCVRTVADKCMTACRQVINFEQLLAFWGVLPVVCQWCSWIMLSKYTTDPHRLYECFYLDIHLHQCGSMMRYCGVQIPAKCQPKWGWVDSCNEATRQKRQWVHRVWRVCGLVGEQGMHLPFARTSKITFFWKLVVPG